MKKTRVVIIANLALKLTPLMIVIGLINIEIYLKMVFKKGKKCAGLRTMWSLTLRVTNNFTGTSLERDNNEPTEDTR